MLIQGTDIWDLKTEKPARRAKMLDGVSDREKQVRKKVKTQKDQVAEENGKKKKDIKYR